MVEAINLLFCTNSYVEILRQYRWWLWLCQTGRSRKSRRDQFIINYTEEDIETIPGFVRRKMVQNLERLEAVYAREVQLRSLGQRTITSYFSRVIPQESINVETASSERPSAAHSA